MKPALRDPYSSVHFQAHRRRAPRWSATLRLYLLIALAVALYNFQERDL